jgi:hypothetical protein
LDVAGLAVAVVSLTYLHLAPTGLSPLRNAVSQYGITEYRAGYRAATLGLAAAGAGAAVGLDKSLPGEGVGVVVALLVVFAVARAVISWFPMDEPGRPRTPTGHNHGIIAIVTFGSVTLAALRLGQVLSQGTQWHWLSPWSTVFGVAMALLVIGIVATRRNQALRGYFGLLERGQYLAIISWLVVLGVVIIAG